MRRTELERQLTALGWHATKTIHILGIRLWSNGNYTLPMPTDDLLLDSLAADILNTARRR